MAEDADANNERGRALLKKWGKLLNYRDFYDNLSPEEKVIEDLKTKERLKNIIALEPQETWIHDKKPLREQS